MKDRTGILAALSDSLCCVCVYWIVASTMIMAGRGWTLGLGWPLLWTGLCTAAFSRLLRRPRSFNLMMALAAAAGCAALALFIAVSGVRMTGLHVFTLAVGAGMASALPMYYLVRRPSLHGHLSCLDVLLLAFAWLLLYQAGRDGADGSGLLTAAVLIVAAGAAVGLRMGSESGAEGAKAMLVALASSAVLALAVAALIALMSRSGALTGSVVHAVGRFFRWLGGGLSSLAARFAALFEPQETDVIAAPVEGVAPAIVSEGTEAAASGGAPVWPGIVLAILLLAGVILAARRLCRVRITLGAENVSAGQDVRTGYIRGAARRRWQALCRALRFRAEAFMKRDTPPGLLVYVQRRAARKKQGRRAGETAREFLRRAAPDGTFDGLADDLERRWYGGGGYTLTPAQCRALRQKWTENQRRGSPW